MILKPPQWSYWSLLAISALAGVMNSVLYVWHTKYYWIVLLLPLFCRVLENKKLQIRQRRKEICFLAGLASKPIALNTQIFMQIFCLSFYLSGYNAFAMSSSLSSHLSHRPILHWFTTWRSLSSSAHIFVFSDMDITLVWIVDCSSFVDVCQLKKTSTMWATSIHCICCNAQWDAYPSCCLQNRSHSCISCCVIVKYLHWRTPINNRLENQR